MFHVLAVGLVLGYHARILVYDALWDGKQELVGVGDDSVLFCTLVYDIHSCAVSEEVEHAVELSCELYLLLML